MAPSIPGESRRLVRFARPGRAHPFAQTLGYLEGLHACCGRFDEANACLDRGEATLRALSDAADLGALLCFRAEAALASGDRAKAAAALAEARRLAGEIVSAATSELGFAIARALERLGGS